MVTFEQTRKKKIIVLSTYVWEGAYVLNAILSQGIHIDNLVIQKIWWKKITFGGYSIKYLMRFLVDHLFGKYGKRYLSIQRVAKHYNVPVVEIQNINNEVDLLLSLQPDLIVVVGSRILKEKVLSLFEGKIINFHTGILPEYRGPYSEFWAVYNNDLGHIGTTIHFLDKGIDTGNIIRQRRIDAATLNPEKLHIANVKAGASLLCEVLQDFLKTDLAASVQKEDDSHYYSYPSDEQVNELSHRIHEKFNINFST